MSREGYTSIPVTPDAMKRLKQRKREAEVKVGEDLTWDNFLLKATEKKW